jgi:plastocyanin
MYLRKRRKHGNRKERFVRWNRPIVPAAASLAGAAAVVLTLAGCGSDSPSGSQAATTPAATTTQAAGAEPTWTAGNPTRAADDSSPAAQRPDAQQAKTITVRIADRKVSPKPGRISVARGETVRLVVTSDVADEIHVHSYDRELRLTPRKPATLQFTADKPGLFEVETHETKLILFQLLVR